MLKKRFKVKGKKALIKRYQDKERVKYYEKARFSNPVWETLNQREIESINNFLLKIKPNKILEIAIGPARVSRHLKHFKKAFGVDSSQEMLTAARKKLNMKKWDIKRGNAFHLSYPKKYFDAVLSFRFIRHFATKDRRALFSQISKVLKPKGYLIFEALNRNMEKNEITMKATGAWDKSFYDEVWTIPELEKELNDYGYKIVKVIPIGNRILASQKQATLLSKINAPEKTIIKEIKKMDVSPSKKNYQWTIIAKKT